MMECRNILEKHKWNFDAACTHGMGCLMDVEYTVVFYCCLKEILTSLHMKIYSYRDGGFYGESVIVVLTFFVVAVSELSEKAKNTVGREGRSTGASRLVLKRIRLQMV